MKAKSVFGPSLILLSVGVFFALSHSWPLWTAQATPVEDVFQAHTPGAPFRFIGGDADAGQDTFEALNCVQCHKVVGRELAAPTGERRLELELGSETRFVKRYEDILLAITNPRHVITERYWMILTPAERAGEVKPFMPNLTDHMTAKQLMDVAAFLDAAYVEGLPGYVVPDNDQF